MRAGTHECLYILCTPHAYNVGNVCAKGLSRPTVVTARVAKRRYSISLRENFTLCHFSSFKQRPVTGVARMFARLLCHENATLDASVIRQIDEQTSVIISPSLRGQVWQPPVVDSSSYLVRIARAKRFSGSRHRSIELRMYLSRLQADVRRR